ncbi:hypothetical protein C8R47DRAFT_461225 [Mycena vitilis]|nr:hypothetical protein C8R47DRAFT_461225 [Mycena vitilis]
MVNIYRPLFLLPSPPALFRGPEIVGIPAVHHPALFFTTTPSTCLCRALDIAISSLYVALGLSRHHQAESAHCSHAGFLAPNHHQRRLISSTKPFRYFPSSFCPAVHPRTLRLCFGVIFNSAATQLSNNGCKSAIQNLRHTKSLMPFIGMKRNTTRPLDFKSCEPFFESRLIKFGFNRVDGCFDYLREPIDSTPTTTYEVLTSFELKAYLDSARTLRRKGLHSRLTYLAAPLHKIATTSM